VDSMAIGSVLKFFLVFIAAKLRFWFKLSVRCGKWQLSAAKERFSTGSCASESGKFEFNGAGTEEVPLA